MVCWPGLREPDVINEVEGLNPLGKRGRNDQGDLRFGGALVITQLAEPSAVPSLCSFRFPKNGAAALPICRQHTVYDVAAKLAVGDGLDEVTFEAAAQQGFKFDLEGFSL